jgi:prepilin-type processing-associated H-X9-DG protein
MKSTVVICECGHHFKPALPEVGGTVPCPACGREVGLPSGVSGKAVGSFALGLLFVFTCLTGLPAILLGRWALDDIRQSGGRLRGKGLAVAGIALGVVGCLCTVALFLPAVRSAREAARRSQCVNNLKQIALALHNYHQSYGCLPPAAIVGKDGKPLLSWRVAIMPFIDAGPLYDQFHLDEPWDSPHNLALLESMPLCYACPSDPSLLKPGMTGYQVVVGPATAFTPDYRPVSFGDFLDGMSQTILVSETRRVVPWTKPEELTSDSPLPLRGLGSHHGYHNNGFNAVMADGSVHFLKGSIAPSVLDALITRNGNEVVSSDSY